MFSFALALLLLAPFTHANQNDAVARTLPDMAGAPVEEPPPPTHPDSMVNPLTGGALVLHESSGGNLRHTAGALSARGVREAQRILTERGFPVAQDGIMGPKTRNAILDYQEKHRLTQTGRLDLETLSALNAPLTPILPKAGEEPPGL
ncbi:MAG TPA: peptidoglycan-binding domain-containing protein [Bdellovibrionota bacterium]|jgi:peptidoglycan hydrolase-like protein with peptidoglycan-binding domain